jgi:hypothetical protein
MNLKLKLALRSTCFLLFPLAFSGAFAQSAQPAVAAYGRLPMQFEQRGDSTAPLHTLVARGPGYSVTLLPTSASLLLHAAAPSRHAVASKANPPELVKMQLAGANADAPMVAEQPLKGYINYMNGPDRRQWRLDVPTFAQARVRDAYPGIDVVYYGTQQQLEYDFVVAPHADASRIRLTLEGAKPIAAADGSLRLVPTKGSDPGI